MFLFLSLTPDMEQICELALCTLEIFLALVGILTYLPILTYLVKIKITSNCEI